MGKTMLKVICWKWVQPNYRSVFNSEHVHILQSMVKRNLDLDHSFVCVTDDPSGLECETIKLWDDPVVQLPENRPNCYRRLKAFSKDAEKIFGTDQILSIDLDSVIVSNITSLVEKMLSFDFSIWGDTAKNTHYNGSFWSLKLGSIPSVWEKFNPKKSPLDVNRAGIVGSDQGWLSYHLGGNENKVTNSDGVLSYRIHILQEKLKRPPNNAKIIFFHGNHDPQSVLTLKESPWIRDYYF
jgi:hypothetical protein